MSAPMEIHCFIMVMVMNNVRLHCNCGYPLVVMMEKDYSGFFYGFMVISQLLLSCCSLKAIGTQAGSL